MKMKIKIPKLISRKKLRATVARRSLRASAETYDDMAEPNMKLSRALLIVLVLHVVAVSGIVAFNVIKTRQDSFVKTAALKPVPQDVGDGGKKVAAPQSTAAAVDNAKPVSHSAPKAPQLATKPADSGSVYVVVKGDNPVMIAKKLKVPYDDLIELNHITDPRKLQIGQRLLVPKVTKGK